MNHTIKPARNALIVDWNSGAKQTNAGRGHGPSSGVRVAMLKGEKSHIGRVNISIQEDTMRRFRWGIGDQVMIARGDFDGMECIAIKRVPRLGFTLTPSHSVKGASEKLAGKPAPATVRRSGNDLADFDGLSVSDAGISDVDGVMVILKPLPVKGD